MEYAKIETLFDRDPDTHKVILGRMRLPEFLLPQRWLVTEKIDGMNIRIILNSGDLANLTPVAQVLYGGRTDKAQIPKPLAAMLQERFPAEKVIAAFDPGTEAIIFGEGYGPGIQKSGGNYAKAVSFRVFDVVVFDPTWKRGEVKAWWLNWPQVEDVARKIGAETVPVLTNGATLDQALAFVVYPSATAGRDGGDSSFPHEGIVARTDPLLFTRTGARLAWKLKARDL